ncbi:MAG: CBS domain containing-hemolysin-like protein [Verrucomicrobiales bacterium]|jgi:CBS domain containing-hemolysin-like protein
MLADCVALIATFPLSAPEIISQVLIIGFFVLLNGFFVAAEFALVKVRASQLDELSLKGNRNATLARLMLLNLNPYLSLCQLGITVSSLVLGALGERWIAAFIEACAHSFGIELAAAVLHTISWAIAISLLTLLHITIGEQVPKTLAIQRSVGTALVVARPLRFFWVVFFAPIWVLNHISNWLLKALFKIDGVSEGELVHSADELALLVEESEKSSEVTETERDILINALALNDLVVRDIMTPRNEIIFLDAALPFAEIQKAAVESQHTRFPLLDGNDVDNPIGLVHVKDLMTQIGLEKPDVMAVKRELKEVPEMMPLDKLLNFFLTNRAHIALAVDEFGGTVGMVTMDNVMAELVGEIQDEFDDEEPEFRRVSDDEFFADGGANLHDLETEAKIELEGKDVSTIGGYVTQLLGRLPEPGSKVRIEDYEITVSKADGRRVQELHFQKRRNDSEFSEEFRAKGARR